MNMLAHFLREMLQGMDAIHPQLALRTQTCAL